MLNISCLEFSDGSPTGLDKVDNKKVGQFLEVRDNINVALFSVNGTLGVFICWKTLMTNNHLADGKDMGTPNATNVGIDLFTAGTIIKAK